MGERGGDKARKKERRTRDIGRRKRVVGFGPRKGMQQKLRCPEGARKVADKRMQIKAGMGNVEEDIAQEGNANKGRALRWCLRNREGRRRREREERERRRERTESEERLENEDRERDCGDRAAR